MYYRTEKRQSKVLLPFLLALVRPHLERYVQFGASQYKKYMDMLEHVTKTSRGWSARHRREGTGLFSLKKQRAKEIKLLSTPMGVITEGMRIDLAVHNDRARGHAAAQVNPSG